MKQGELKSPFMSPNEAADFMKIKLSTLYAWCGRKKMKFPKRYHGRRLVFLAEDLLAWSDAQNKIESLRQAG